MKIVKLIVALIILGGAVLIGGSVRVSVQREILETLRTIASIVFGVVGAWIALVYPKALEDLLKADGSPDSQEGNISRLLRPLLFSTAVLAYTLLFDFVYLVAQSFEIAPSALSTIRRVSFALTAGMTALQFWALALTLGPTHVLRKELRLLRERKEYVDQLLSRSEKGED